MLREAHPYLLRADLGIQQCESCSLTILECKWGWCVLGLLASSRGAAEPRSLGCIVVGLLQSELVN
eukprot:1934180-Rhodomonas_salina.1